MGVLDLGDPGRQVVRGALAPDHDVLVQGPVGRVGEHRVLHVLRGRVHEADGVQGGGDPTPRMAQDAEGHVLRPEPVLRVGRLEGVEGVPVRAASDLVPVSYTHLTLPTTPYV